MDGFFYGDADPSRIAWLISYPGHADSAMQEGCFFCKKYGRAMVMARLLQFPPVPPLLVRATFEPLLYDMDLSLNSGYGNRTMYESKHQTPIPAKAFYRRMAWHFLTAICVMSLSLAVGVLGYVYFEGMGWAQAFLNASTLLSGLGLAEVPETPEAQLFASAYALFSGFVFLVVAGIVAAPLLHRLLHRFHWDGD